MSLVHPQTLIRMLYVILLVISCYRHMQKIFVIYSCFFLCLASLQGQEITLSEVPVSIDGEELAFPYLGGIIAGQFSNIDINLDGIDDLLIYDRLGGTVSPLISDGQSYSYDPTFADIFPRPQTWMLLRDFNNDGIMDIFSGPTTTTIAGVEVWRGSIENGRLSYEMLRFPERPFDLLFIPIGRGFTQIFVSVIDLPEISDIDKDGDIDILAFDPAGSFVTFYQNMAVERNLSLDTMVFELGDQCYGKFVEGAFSEVIDLSPNDMQCATFAERFNDDVAEARHSGSTVTAFDENDDGLPDLLLGDVAYDGLVQLTNNGSLENPWITEVDLRFPTTSVPAQMEVFLSAFNVELPDSEGIIVCPNDQISGQTEDFIWYYTRTDDGYELVDTNLFIDDMMFHGRHSRPIFFDADGDELVDILVGSSGTSAISGAPQARLQLYRNVGTPREPAYELTDRDYLNFSEFNVTSRWFSPADGDLDGDGDIDLLIGDDVGYLYYVENQSGLANVFDFRQPVYQAFDINVSAFASPTIFDFNQDGLGDIILGEQNFNSVDDRLGSLNYFQNIGEIEEADFNPVETQDNNDPAFGDIFLRNPNFVSNFSSAAIHDNGEQWQFLASNEAGDIHYYGDISEFAPSDSFSLTSILSDSVFIGERTTVDLDDIDGDGSLEIVFGNGRGGITLYETELVSNEAVSSTEPVVADAEEFLIVPNPASNFAFIQTEESQFDWQLYNLKGQMLQRGDALNPRIELSQFPSALYIVEIITERDVQSYRIVKP